MGCLFFHYLLHAFLAFFIGDFHQVNTRRLFAEVEGDGLALALFGKDELPQDIVDLGLLEFHAANEESSRSGVWVDVNIVCERLFAYIVRGMSGVGIEQFH